MITPRLRTPRLQTTSLRTTSLLLAASLTIGQATQAVRAAPAQVLLLRHGHKSGLPGDFNLSPQGLERAIALAALLPDCFGTPSHIRTFYLDPVSSKNARSYQTAVPLAVATRVNIQIDESSMADSRQSGKDILTAPRYRNGRVVLIWEHRRMPDLAAGLGWPAMPPVPDDNFDDLFELTYPPGSSQPLVRHLSQSALLSGRQSCPHQAKSPATPASP
ncbi:MAG: hypothetical protein VKI83_08200 [Synechococcaceae cyanobacterium]|nr:hypothetical protein [Synechococcaceae cyanobacterium]